MRKSSFVVTAVLALAACGGSQKSAPQAKAASPACTTAAQNTGRMLTEAAAGAVGPAVITDVVAAIDRHCVADAWSVEARDCIGKAVDQAALDRCDPLLTQAQKDAAGQEISEIVMRAMGGAGYGGAGYGGAGYGGM